MSSLRNPVPRQLAPALPSADVSRTQLAFLVFGALAAVYSYWLGWRAFLPCEINGNEPWNAWHVRTALQGGPLYPNRDDLIVNNYPPLSFYLVGLASTLTGDVIYAGRMISLISTAAIAFSVALCIRALGCSRATAAFGALWFLATMVRFFYGYVGMNDPNLLALAIMGMALALFLRRLSAGKSLEPTIACMVLAGFFKHNIIAIPLTAMLWLYLVRRGLALRAAVFGAGMAALGLALCTAVYGPNFIEQLLMPRKMSIGHIAVGNAQLQSVTPALFFWCIWAWSSRFEAAARFSALLVTVSFATALLQMSGNGVAQNALFELVFASGIAVALAFERIASTSMAKRFGAVQTQTIVISVLVLRLLLEVRPDPYLLLFSHSYREEADRRIIAMNAEVERIKALPGPVACSVMTVCYRAGKSHVFDAFVWERVATKRWSNKQLNQAIVRSGIRFELIENGLSFESLMPARARAADNTQ